MIFFFNSNYPSLADGVVEAQADGSSKDSRSEDSKSGVTGAADKLAVKKEEDSEQKDGQWQLFFLK